MEMKPNGYFVLQFFFFFSFSLRAYILDQEMKRVVHNMAVASGASWRSVFVSRSGIARVS